MTQGIGKTALQSSQLNSLLPTLPEQYHRLILVVGAHGAGKTRLLQASSQEHGWPYLNVNLQLSHKLLDLTSKQRPLRVRRILSELIDGYPEPVLALDNIELLFDPGLRQEPLSLLQLLSRNKGLIAAWPGAYDQSKRVLTYAEPGHPEYRRYERPEVMLLALATEGL